MASASWSPNSVVSYPSLAKSGLRLVGCMLYHQNPLVWSFRQGSWNEREDMEGPYYIVGAPDRQIEDGKAIMLEYKDVQESGCAFLLTGRLTTQSGKPVAKAELDWWQADTSGSYAFASYKLRGTLKTDAQGRFEVLTVAPGKYGPTNFKRAGHFHFIITPPKDAGVLPLTTQVYVCRANSANELGPDILNFFRRPRYVNMVQCYQVPDASSQTAANFALPSLPLDEKPLLDAARRWDSILDAEGDKLGVPKDNRVRVEATAHVDLTMTATTKKGWL